MHNVSVGTYTFQIRDYFGSNFYIKVILSVNAEGALTRSEHLHSNDIKILIFSLLFTILCIPTEVNENS